jgi:polyisoprenoid-binding protein YceI
MRKKAALSFMKIRRPVLHALAMALIGVVPRAVSQDRPIDTRNSKVHIYVFKTGLFSGFADNHDVEAALVEGTINESASRVSFVIDARQVKVLDPHLSPDKRQQVQERMLGPEVLDSTRFPQISFESTDVKSEGQGQLLVEGRLSLHGATRLVSARVQKQGGRYVGTCTLKQRDFGIAPISIGAGTVKVKNELKIEFEVRANTPIAGE